MPDIYDPAFVRGLFDRMSASYTRMNRITSFGFSERWRRQVVEELAIGPGARVADLLSGMGECWGYVFAQAPSAHLVAVDFSPEMMRMAERRRARHPDRDVRLLEEDALATSLPDAGLDHVVSGFGLKTFDDRQLRRLAMEVRRVLRPGGTFAFVDVSVPPVPVLRPLYLGYLRHAIPVLGRVFLGDPATYRMLGEYTVRYGDSRRVLRAFEAAGLEVAYRSYFFGCATGVVGRRP